MLLMKVPPVANAKAERMEATGQLAMPGACLICVKVAFPLNSGVETAWTSMLSRSPLRGGGMVVDFMIQAPAGTLRVTSDCPPFLQLDGKGSFDFAQDGRERRFLQPTGWFGTQGCGSFAVPSFHPPRALTRLPRRLAASGHTSLCPELCRCSHSHARKERCK